MRDTYASPYPRPLLGEAFGSVTKTRGSHQAWRPGCSISHRVFLTREYDLRQSCRELILGCSGGLYGLVPQQPKCRGDHPNPARIGRFEDHDWDDLPLAQAAKTRSVDGGDCHEARALLVGRNDRCPFTGDAFAITTQLPKGPMRIAEAHERVQRLDRVFILSQPQFLICGREGYRVVKPVHFPRITDQPCDPRPILRCQSRTFNVRLYHCPHQGLRSCRELVLGCSGGLFGLVPQQPQTTVGLTRDR
jgi:hypothetical protein